MFNVKRSKYSLSTVGDKSITPSEYLGIDTYLYKQERRKEAAETPDTYLEKRNKMIVAVKDKLNDGYEELVKTFTDQQVPLAKARELAMSSTKGVYEKSMEQIDTLFPTDFNVMERLKLKGEIKRLAK